MSINDIFTGYQIKTAIHKSVINAKNKSIDFTKFDYGSIKNGNGLEKSLESLLTDYLDCIRTLVLNDDDLNRIRPTLDSDASILMKWILTIPAKFNAPHQYIYRKAVEKHEVSSIEFVTEGLAGTFGTLPSLVTKDNSVLITIDCGGCTFDVCVSECKNEKWHTLTSDSFVEVGGVELTKALCRVFVPSYDNLSESLKQDIFDTVETQKVNMKNWGKKFLIALEDDNEVTAIITTSIVTSKLTELLKTSDLGKYLMHISRSYPSSIVHCFGGGARLYGLFDVVKSFMNNIDPKSFYLSKKTDLVAAGALDLLIGSTCDYNNALSCDLSIHFERNKSMMQQVVFREGKTLPLRKVLNYETENAFAEGIQFDLKFNEVTICKVDIDFREPYPSKSVPVLISVDCDRSAIVSVKVHCPGANYSSSMKYPIYDPVAVSSRITGKKFNIY